MSAHDQSAGPDAESAARAEARRLFGCGVAAALPGPALARSLSRHPFPAPAPGARLHLLAFGKAASLMMEEALRHLPAPPATAIVVTVAGAGRELPGVETHIAGHPVPDAAGLAAARRIEAVLTATRPGDAVVALVSGGASALLPAPVVGVSLEEKGEVSRLMLAAGMDIAAMNLVRQNLSRLKGGGMLRLAGCPVTSYILSDVIGDDPRAIASGPTVGPLGNRAGAAAALREAGLWETLPQSVAAHLSRADDPARPPLPPAGVRLIGSNGISVAAMAAAHPGARVVSGRLTGSVEDAARLIVAGAAETGPGDVLLWGGETTAEVRGDGEGGRNQELALRVALLARGLPSGWAFLSGGTDGRDGPTDAAGGLVDGGTLARMAAGGVDPAAALARSDSYHALAASGDLLMTGPTGTNVADLQIFVCA